MKKSLAAVAGPRRIGSPPTRRLPRSIRAGSWREAITGAVAAWLVIRLLLTAYAFFTVSTEPLARASATIPRSFFTLFFRWDSSYYLDVAQNGYFAATDPANLQAFLPGYPLAARLAAIVLFPGGGLSTQDVTIGLWTASALASVISAIGLWKLALDRFGGRVALGAIVLLLAGPYSVFLDASYSEPLFLAFAVFAWYHAIRGRWWLSGLLAAGASLTRIDGLFLAAALAVLYLQSEGPSWKRYLLRATGLAAISLSTLLGYFVYLFVLTRDPVAWFTAERAGWHRRFTLPWLSGLATLTRALDPHASSAHRAQSLLEVVFALLCIVGGIVLARQRRWGAVVLVATTLASLMTSTTYLSLSRESLLFFPLALMIASFRDIHGRRWIFRVSLAAGFLLFLFNTHQFVLGMWAQ